MFRSIERAAVIALACGLLLAACGRQDQEKPMEPEVGAEAAAPEPTRIGSTARTRGELDGVQELSLAFRPAPDPARAGYYGLGSTATPEVIAGWDIDIRPDGTGLPPGSATAEDGEAPFEEKCATCHGFFGEGQGRWPKLAGREELTGDRPEKTVGNYWPYASTLWDYIHRAMPFYEPQSLSDREVYALTAYVLYLNDLVDYDQELNQANLADVEMPNREGFFEDPRPDVANVACMQNCKDPGDIKITWDSTELGVTPVSHFKEAEAAEQAERERVVDGGQIYEQACKTCHSVGLAGAPRVGVAADWSERKAQGLELLVEHAINGYQGKSGYMPPRGGQSQLSDAEIEAAVNHMVSAGSG